jgi:F-type H+-transporting ATPase subunit a
MFAGGILITLIAMLPWYVQWAPNGIWKLFDLFVGVMQAIIFSLLTIMYFGQSMELEDEHH